MTVVIMFCLTLGFTNFILYRLKITVKTSFAETGEKYPGRVISKALKMVPVPTLLGAQHHKASISFSSPNKYRTTNFATLTKIEKIRKVRYRDYY